MFEKIVLRRSEFGPDLTPGEIAEALLFYRNVHIVMDPLTLKPLIDSFGPHGLLRLLERDRVSGFYAEDMCLTQNETVRSLAVHCFTTAILAGKDGERPRKGRKARLCAILEMSGLTGGEAVRFAERFAKRVKMQTFSSDYFIPGGVHKAAGEEILDRSYVNGAARRVVANTIGFEEYAADLQFYAVPFGDNFFVRTNLDFAAGNARRKLAAPQLEAITESNILSSLFDAGVDVALASHYGGDFYTSAVNSDIVRLRYAELLKRTGISRADLLQLQDVVLDGYPALREVINAKQRSFDDFLDLLDKSDKFREWIHGIGPDAKLVPEYINQVTAEGWTSKLPVKIARYVIATAIGIAHPIGGPAISAADMFLLERLARGWRPNHFVDDRLKPFLATDESD